MSKTFTADDGTKWEAVGPPKTQFFEDGALVIKPVPVEKQAWVAGWDTRRLVIQWGISLYQANAERRLA